MKHKLEDISGWRMAEHGFPESRWTVISKDPEKPRNLIYKCDCGTIKSTSDYNIRYGKSLSCGCRSRELITKTRTIDMTGWKMWEHGVPDSIYTVLRKDEETHGNWICQCACGAIKSVSGTALRSGNTKSCGCKYSQKIDMTGWIMKEHGVENSRLTIIEEDKAYIDAHKLTSNLKSIYWKCLCECGNIFSARGTSIRAGEILSCGCLQKEKTAALGTDLADKTFNNITVLEKTECRDKNGRIIWKCRCKCGTIMYLRTSALTSNSPTYSCGCIKSQGEEKICKWLTEHNFEYKREYTFSDLSTEIGGHPRFDFAVNFGGLYLIEFQGQQHYLDISFGEYQREITDKLKKDYCKNNNIPLLEIRYDDNIEKILEDTFIKK